MEMISDPAVQKVLKVSIDIFLSAANHINEQLRASNDQFNFCYNAVRQHRQNIEKYTKKGEVGFIIYQQGFYDKVQIQPRIGSKDQIWSRRTCVGGKNYISVYFFKMRAIKTSNYRTLILDPRFQPCIIQGVKYVGNQWVKHNVQQAYFNSNYYGYYGLGWKFLCLNETRWTPLHGFVEVYRFIFGFGYNFEELKEFQPQQGCMIY